MRVPLAIVVLPFAAGIVAAGLGGAHGEAWWIPPAVVLVVVTTVGQAFRPDSRHVRSAVSFALLALSSALLGWTWRSIHESTHRQLVTMVHHSAGQVVRVDGRVCAPVTVAAEDDDSVPRNQGSPQRFDSQTDSMEGARRVDGFRLCPIGWSGWGLDVKPGMPLALPLHQGDHVVLIGRVRSSRPPRNPFDFDEHSWFKGQRTVGRFHPDSLMVRHPVPDPGHTLGGIRHFWERRIQDTFARAPLASDLYGAMMLGHRDRLSPSVIQAFRSSGLAHLLAISGLHIAILALAVHLVVGVALRRVPLPSPVRGGLQTGIAAVLLLGYGFLVGWVPSVRRAVIMASLLSTAVTLRRRHASGNALCAAGGWMLLLDPGAVSGLGFQLSFAAVAAILALTPSKHAMNQGMLSTLRSSYRVSLAAGVGTLPVLLTHFGRVPLSSLLLSPIAVGVLGFGLPMAWVAVVLPSSLDLFPALAAALLAHVQVLLASMGTTQEWIPVWRSDPGMAWTGLGVTVAFLLWRLSPVRRRATLLGLSLVLGSILVWTPTVSVFDDGLEVIFLDVGQGDAAIIRYPNGQILIVDTGPDNFSAGTVIRHVERLSPIPPVGVVLTHPHRDHDGGLEALVRRWPGVPIHRNLQAGMHLDIDPESQTRVLSPGMVKPADENEASIVLQIQYGRTRLLLTGDIESEAESLLVRRFSPLLGSDVVKVAHHGSATSSTSGFVRTVEADWAVISAGRNNRFSHPDPQVVRSWASFSRVHLTAASGALWLRSDGTRFESRDAWTR